MPSSISGRARILTPSADSLALCGEAIRRGEVVGMPTETVYGLAGGAFQQDALARIFETKERPTFDPLIIHIGRGQLPAGIPLGQSLTRMKLARLDEFTPLALKRLELLAAAFWPGPLTLVLPKDESVPDLATAGLPTVALRMPRHPVAQALIASAGTPLAAPSANRFGRISPTSARDVAEELGDRIDFILDGGASEVGVESSVLSVSAEGELRLLRPGGVSPEAIETATGVMPTFGSGIPVSQPGQGLVSPGSLESHYAPSLPMDLLPAAFWEVPEQELRALIPRSDQALGLLIVFGDPELAALRFRTVTGCEVYARTLSRRGEVDEAARNLFAVMRELDALPLAKIHAEPARWLDSGLGYAIADRIRRAAARR